jgi:hypothetical protein
VRLAIVEFLESGTELLVDGDEKRFAISATRTRSVVNLSVAAVVAAFLGQDALLCHLQRHDVDLHLVGIDVGVEDNVMALVSFDGVGIDDGPGFAVLVAGEAGSISADFAFDVDGFLRGIIALHAVVFHGVLGAGDYGGRESQGETEGKKSLHGVLLRKFANPHSCGVMDV